MSESPVDSNGAVRIPAFELPPSPGWSPQAKRAFIRRAQAPAVSARSVTQTAETDEADWLMSAAGFRSDMAGLHLMLLERIVRPRFAVDIRDDTIAGVPVQIVEPVGGPPMAHRDAVLINLHGGAFVGGAEYCGLVESIPLAALGGYRIVVVDYRQGWEHRFPAASQDVASVYAALLDSHEAQRIGIFGYSAGGSLTAQVLAWFSEHDLPRPAAAAICSAGAGGPGAGGDGDATFWASVAMGGAPVEPGAAGVDAATQFGYFADADLSDPLVAPLYHPAVLGRFPPTLLISGTRSFDLSAAALTHRALRGAGVSAELSVWEGMWHCFPYNANMPEAEEAFACLIEFSGRQLSTAKDV